jgi:phosphoribosylglycinamide formyltransferase 2
MPDTDFRIFGKPSVRPFRRMGVGLAHGPLDADAHTLVAKAQEVAGKLSVG